jgi:acetylornithine deacetylase/succinyl-diaminopimelate desuccinylase-like protein
LKRRISYRTESRNPERKEALDAYLRDEIAPSLERRGFSCEVMRHPDALGPFLIAERRENPSLPTVLIYGHGDVVGGLDGSWDFNGSPWHLNERDGRLFGRGIADNKGQHTINLAALEAVAQVRGRLGFNVVCLIEMGEEVGSPGLREFCRERAARLRADVLIASDGPRVSEARPTIYLGARGARTFYLSIKARDGTHHSGNWGGLLSDPAIQLVHALGTISSPSGQILIPQWVPERLPENVRLALAGCEVDGGPDGPAIDMNWGESGLTPAEQVYGWCSFDILSLVAGDPKAPMSAVPESAEACCQLRFVVDIDEEQILPALRRHLDRHGYTMVGIREKTDGRFPATRLDIGDAWVRWVAQSLESSTGKKPAILPNVGGSLPNDILSELTGGRTIWIPHSYPGASNHGANENMPMSVLHEGLRAMTGLFWDLGEASEHRGLPRNPDLTAN